jgi:putative protease
MLQAFLKEYDQLPPVEALVYARYELMALRHCVIRHALGESFCGRCNGERFSLQDDMGRLFPVVKTERCENRLFEGRPTERKMQELLDLGIRHFRVELLDEDATKSREIVKKHLRLLENGT